MQLRDVRLTDEQINVFIGNLLRAGVLLATAVVLLGAVRYLAKYGHALPDYAMFSGEPADLRNSRGIASAAWDLRGRGIIQLGLLLLIATPVARVMFSVVAFVLERDYLYVLITLVVLSILLFSLLSSSF